MLNLRNDAHEITVFVPEFFAGSGNGIPNLGGLNFGGAGFGGEAFNNFSNLHGMFPGTSRPDGNLSSQVTKDPPIYKDLHVSLEELLNGATKKLKITKKVQAGVSSITEEKILTINVKKGWKAGTKITFPEEGDQKPGITPADIIFVIKDKEHRLFKRDANNNLLYGCKLSLKDALTGIVVKIPTLEGTEEQLQLESVIQPGSTRIILGKGLPLPKLPNHRGNLIVNFIVTIPEDLSENDRQKLSEILQ